MVLSIVSAGYGDHSDAAKVVDVTGRINAAVRGDPKTVSGGWAGQRDVGVETVFARFK
jgi:hypothetical protein